MWIFWMTSLPIYMCLLYHHGNPEGFTSIVKLLSASSNQNELVRISSSSGKLMCQIRVDYYNNK